MLRHRLISGSLLIFVLLGVVLWKSPLAAIPFAVLGCVLVWGALREFFRMMQPMGAPGYVMPTMMGAVLLVLANATVGAFGGPALAFEVDALLGGAYLLGGIFLIFQEQDFRRGVQNLMVSLFGMLYAAWTLSFYVKLFFHSPTGPLLMLFVLIVTKAGDMGGYAVGNLTGRTLGNHKMTPRLSPKKSWEGLAGSVAFSALLALILQQTLLRGEPPFGPLEAAVVGGVLAVLGLIGDLAESVLKRASGRKDSGGSLPGLGGVLDVVDSLVLVAPLFYGYLLLRTA